MFQENHSVNEKGHFAVAGIDTVELAKKYGTPLYILDENMIRENCRIYASAMKKYFGGESVPLFASKALSFKGIYKIANEESMAIDVVSSGELYTALQAGVPAEKMYFHGNCKTDFDIKYGVDNKVGYFIVDNVEELDRIDSYAGSVGVSQKILLRVTPGIDPHTFEAVNTGKVDSKFGAAVETGQAKELTLYALTKKNIRLRGFHCHIGSQIFDCQPFYDTVDIMFKFIKNIDDARGYKAEVFNIGGGFAVRYTEEDPQVDYEAYIKSIAGHMKAKCSELGMDMPVILMEPGRSIVAAAGVTLYTAESIKVIPGYKKYVSIDGGMTDNPRYALYGSKYTVLVANKADKPKNCIYTVAGRCCESGDLIGEDMPIQEPEHRDIIAVLVTGAYNYSMASNYNRVGRPPIVMLRDGKDYLAVRRESFEDITACDL